MKLPKSLIKKYGVSKKAWAVLRGRKARSRGASTMARRKRKSSSRGGNKFGRMAKVLLSAVVSAGYGAYRNDIASKVPKVQALGNYNDEVILGGVATGLSLVTGNQWINAVTKPVSNIEMGIMGAKVRGSPQSTTMNGQDANIVFY